MLRFPIKVLASFNFIASVTFNSPTKIVVLALRANPSPIWKVEIGVNPWSLNRLIPISKNHLRADLFLIFGTITEYWLFFIFRCFFRHFICRFLINLLLQIFLLIWKYLLILHILLTLSIKRVLNSQLLSSIRFHICYVFENTTSVIVDDNIVNSSSFRFLIFSFITILNLLIWMTALGRWLVGSWL